MTYRAIGLMSGSSLDGLDMVFAEYVKNADDWTFEIKAAQCLEYSSEWKTKMENAILLNAWDYQLLHVDYGHYTGEMVNRFINENQLYYQVAIVASHGHTTFHDPKNKMTAQLGDGASIAAETGLPVISDLRSLDVAFGGQGAPIVPIGEKFLFKQYSMFLNLGGIANISFNNPDRYIAFDVCPANRVLNMLANLRGLEFDIGGQLAGSGSVHFGLLSKLNALEYYAQQFPKSLANNFGVDIVFPLIRSFNIPEKDALRTYVEHIVQQIIFSIKKVAALYPDQSNSNNRLLVTGGGAFNVFVVQKLSGALKEINIELVIPDDNIVKYKEALIMGFIGVLRWRQENNVLSSVTGAERDSIGGAVWIGQEA